MTMRIQEPPEDDATQEVFTPNDSVAALQTSLGVQAETAALSDTPTDKGLIGLTKRGLQQITTFMGRLPTALGQQLGANSISTIGSSQDPVVVAVGVASSPAAAADNDSTAPFFGWVKYLASRITTLINAVGTGNGYLNTMSSDTSTVNTAYDTGKLYSGATPLTPKFATIAASSSGNNTLVAAVTGKKIRVLAYKITGSGAVNAKFQSGAGGTDLTGLEYIAAAGGGVCAPFNPVGWFETASATLLNLNLSAGQAVGGHLTYVEI